MKKKHDDYKSPFCPMTKGKIDIRQEFGGGSFFWRCFKNCTLDKMPGKVTSNGKSYDIYKCRNKACGVTRHREVQGDAKTIKGWTADIADDLRDED